MNPAPTIEAMRTASRALSSDDPRQIVRTAQALQDALDAVKADALARISESRVFELDGASTLSTWVRDELRLSAKDTAALVNAASTLTHLPAVAQAAAEGLIRAEHIAVFSYGLKHIGTPTMAQSEPWLLDVARHHEPNQLLTVVRALREAVYPDELDKAWAEGMDRQDIQVVRVPGGWHVTGFLNATTGAKLRAVLDTVAKPTDKDDTRPGSERRVDGFDHLITRILQSGLPSDKGVRPHLSVIADAETLRAALDHQPGITAAPTKPAQLAGYGPIGPRLLTYLACLADFTPILTRKDFPANAAVLNVGRTHRNATHQQRLAVNARQGGVCATPGCHHTHLEIHHVIWWSHGGPTNLDLLIGLCVRCHHLLHRGLLKITGNATDGFEFTNQDNRPLIAAYRQRLATHRENWAIHKTAITIERRRQERLQVSRK
jgi:hypothetical protein